MGSCNIDHSLEDVYKKLESQKEFLSFKSLEKCKRILSGNPSQALLNEIFHMLKKYDLATQEERANRDEKIAAL
ncbi:group-specific protein [Litchfieldia alkalitelluris]|uniref:group-specific protein n=1 Tax=Litchfieldia alkalitelluris TaxID=304268 RepID=UPI000997BF10|nr:group-specific protein [Litchfieldia alkalitelluris]